MSIFRLSHDGNPELESRRAHLIQHVDQLVFADSSAQLTALSHPGEQLLDGARAVRFHERYPRDCSRLGGVGQHLLSPTTERAIRSCRSQPRRERILSRREEFNGERKGTDGVPSLRATRSGSSWSSCLRLLRLASARPRPRLRLVLLPVLQVRRRRREMMNQRRKARDRLLAVRPCVSVIRYRVSVCSG